jgi:hypothetical protein
MQRVKTRSWVFFIFGIPALFRAWAGLSVPQPTTGAYVSLASGIGLTVMGAVAVWVERKRAAAERKQGALQPLDESPESVRSVR